MSKPVSVSPFGGTATGWAHGAVVSQVPNGEISCSSPRISDARWLATRTRSRPRSPGARAIPSRGSATPGNSTSDSAARAWVSVIIRKNSSSGGSSRSGGPASPTVTSAASCAVCPAVPGAAVSSMAAVTKYLPSAAPGVACSDTSQAVNPCPARSYRSVVTVSAGVPSTSALSPGGSTRVA
jgi:hypothetical protein